MWNQWLRCAPCPSSAGASQVTATHGPLILSHDQLGRQRAPVMRRRRGDLGPGAERVMQRGPTDREARRGRADSPVRAMSRVPVAMIVLPQPPPGGARASAQPGAAAEPARAAERARPPAPTFFTLGKAFSSSARGVPGCRPCRTFRCGTRSSTRPTPGSGTSAARPAGRAARSSRIVAITAGCRVTVRAPGPDGIAQPSLAPPPRGAAVIGPGRGPRSG